MNYLAHLFLAGTSEGLVIGNFIADLVKGSNYLSYTSDIKKGILMHRAIDTFTDNHTLVKQSIQKLQPHHHKFAGVLVDIFYDHFLAKNWHLFHLENLENFAQNSYLILENNYFHLPEKAKFILPYMKSGNWLYNYRYLAGIKKTLEGMSKRTKFENNMQFGIIHLTEFYEEFEKEFLDFFPQLVSHVEHFKS